MKIPFVDFTLYSKMFPKNGTQTPDSDAIIEDNSVIQTASRSSTIVTSFIGKTIAVYTGNKSKNVMVTPSMIGFKLGCFAYTKKLGISIHNSEHNRKKIAKMKRKITQKKVRKTATKSVKKSSTKKTKK